MPRTVLALGELLVEVMRPERGVGLGVPGTFRGPFPSGAPAIFAWAAARLGAGVRFLGVRGADAFGDLCEHHLRDAGVDVQGVRADPERLTGVAFVSYEHSGSRSFLFHLREAAAADLSPEDVTEEALAGVAWLHVTGSSLGVSESMRGAVHKAVEQVKSRGGTLSFDPNLRLELMSQADIEALCGPLLERADVVLPSGSEASLLTGIPNPDEACRALLRNAQTVVLKLGERGCKVFREGLELEVPSIPVTEADPTGAGDCFAAGFAVASLEGQPLERCARFANVVGALSVTAFGPTQAEVSRALVEKRLGAI